MKNTNVNKDLKNYGLAIDRIERVVKLLLIVLNIELEEYIDKETKQKVFRLSKKEV